MSNIPARFAPAGLFSRQNALSDAQFPTYVKQQSFSARESLEAGLTIQTKEGDLVTLTSSSFSQFDAHNYNSKGVVQAEAGKSLVALNQRDITLTSGESFSFSVVGNLNDDELEDIEAIIKGIDQIISEMAQGDMKDAVGIALSMGGYDTVSSFSADITYQRSYAMRSEQRGGPQDLPAAEEVPEVAAPEVQADADEAGPVAALPVQEGDEVPAVAAESEDDDGVEVAPASGEVPVPETAAAAGNEDVDDAEEVPEEGAVAEAVAALEEDDEADDAVAELVKPDSKAVGENEDAVPGPVAPEPFPENSIPWSKNKSSIKNIDNFLEKMITKLQDHDEKEVGFAQGPLNKLFNHHKEKMKDQDEMQTAYQAVETAQKKINTIIEEMIVNIFEGQLTTYMKN